EKYAAHTIVAAMASAADAFAKRAPGRSPPVVCVTMSASVNRANGGAENFDVSRHPSATPTHAVAVHDGRRRQATSATVVANSASAAAPSTVAMEKCAMSGAEKTNNASARFAPPSENIRRAVAQSRHASAT